ncbi:kinase-like domain-containing protein [Blastocladiella britannica]|nr:kinase-like domain-containing protein [Blastocladiella britannica]
MSWLNKLKPKKSKDTLVDKDAPAAPAAGSTSSIHSTATASYDALAGSSASASAAASSGISSATSGAAVGAGGLPGIKLTGVAPTMGTNAAVTQALAARPVSGLLSVRVLDGRDVHTRAAGPNPVGPTGASTTPSSTGSGSHHGGAGDHHALPYIVLAYDKNEVVVNATGGSVTAPVWRARATFDLTHDADLAVHVFLRSPAASAAAAAAAAAANDGGGGSPMAVDGSGSAPGSPMDLTSPGGSLGSDTHVGSALVEAGQLPTSDAAAVRDVWVDVYAAGSTHPAGSVHLQLVYRAHVANTPVTIDDFDLLKVIGKGSFGKVMQVRKKDTGRVYALKILKKSHIVAREEVTHTLSERNVLTKLRHPFIVNMKFAFQTPQKLYLVLPFINGGELFKHLSQEGRFEEERARFYAAELTSALECLHSYEIIYRDLKPENILLDYAGHIALCDFGLCKLNMGAGARTNTFCGTPEYLACEVLLGNGYTKSVDWWTLGILIFEMLTGLPPFYDENLNEMYRKILYAPLQFPPFLSPAAQSLLVGLVDRDPERRIGGNPTGRMPGGAAEIKAHPFFATIDWKALNEKRLVPPFKPSVANAYDTSNFDEEFTRELPMDSVANESILSQTAQGQFAGFTYIPGSDLQAASGAVPIGNTYQSGGMLGSSVGGGPGGHLSP